MVEEHIEAQEESVVKAKNEVAKPRKSILKILYETAKILLIVVVLLLLLIDLVQIHRDFNEIKVALTHTMKELNAKIDQQSQLIRNASGTPIPQIDEGKNKLAASIEDINKIIETQNLHIIGMLEKSVPNVNDFKNILAENKNMINEIIYLQTQQIINILEKSSPVTDDIRNILTSNIRTVNEKIEHQNQQVVMVLEKIISNTGDIKNILKDSTSAISEKVEQQSHQIISGLDIYNQNFTDIKNTLTAKIDTVDQKIEQQNQQVISTLEKANPNIEEIKNILFANMATIDKKIEEQSQQLTILLENTTPKVLPPEAQSELEKIEEAFTSEAKWPTSAMEIDIYSKQLDKIVESVPPSARAELLPHLLPRLWEIKAFEALSHEPEKNTTGLAEYAQVLDAVLEDRPPNASNALAERLKKRADETAKQIEQSDRAAAFAQAQDALSKDGDAKAALELVSAYDDGEAKQLAARLAKEVVRRSISRNIEEVQKKIELCSKIDDDTLKEYAYAQAQHALLEFRLQLEFLTPELEAQARAQLKAEINEADMRLEPALTTLREAKRKKEAEKLRRYQTWAVEQIRELELFHGDDSADKRRTIIRLLGPINQAYLEEAPRQYYHDIYRVAFDKLKDDDKFAVRKALTETEKNRWNEP